MWFVGWLIAGVATAAVVVRLLYEDNSKPGDAAATAFLVLLLWPAVVMWGFGWLAGKALLVGKPSPDQSPSDAS